MSLLSGKEKYEKEIKSPMDSVVKSSNVLPTLEQGRVENSFKRIFALLLHVKKG